MRIACLHLPQFALQCVTRTDPSLRGAALVVVGAGQDRPDCKPGAVRVALHSPIVQACSRAAWALGARVGMTATAAHALSPDLKVVTADAVLERETVRALADVLLATSPVVDVGGRIGVGGAHLAMYCEVPGKTRGASFGDRLVQRLEALGLTGRIGIADDRFTAWVAAWGGASDRTGRDEDAGVVSVPRGGSAAFLAPRPLSLLAISPEVQHMLEALGVRTLGEFAALPAPSVTRRSPEGSSSPEADADYQALARGEGGHVLRPYAPEAPIREAVVIGNSSDPKRGPGIVVSMPAAVALLAERIALRLAGRGRGAARIELSVDRPEGEGGERLVPITPTAVLARRSLESLLDRREAPNTRTGSVLSSAEEVAEAIGAALGDDDRTAWRLRVAVTGEALAGDELSIAIDPSSNDSASAPAIVETLSVVLSNTGGSLDLAFGPASISSSTPGPTAGVLRAERRDAHRRTRRGKQRRRIETLVQPRLFKNLP